MPTIGILTSRGQNDVPHLMAAVGQGLADTGFVEGRNLTVEWRFADNRNERLPELAASLVQRGVAVIAATTTPAALAAKAATSTIPIVFETGSDPVAIGLVNSLSRPGGNITGVTQLNTQLVPKRIELLHEVIPSAKVLAVLVNSDDPVVANTVKKGVMESAARDLGVEIPILTVGSERDFNTVFDIASRMRVGGLVIGTDALFTAREEQLAALALQRGLPAAAENREFVAAGGLISYGGEIVNAYRLTGVYVGRIVKGENPANLPVQQSTGVHLFVNLKTAKSFGLTVPPSLLARADDVIE
jgi:putative ABC transport system substrate-binding protein